MSVWTLPFKALWWGDLLIMGFLRFAFYASLTGSYFERVGWGSRFGRRIRLGSPNANIRIGRNCGVGDDVFLCTRRQSYIELQDGSSVNRGCVIVALYGIRIGRGSAVAEYVTIRDHNHGFENAGVPIKQQGYKGDCIEIGDDVWIGRGVFVGPGVTIGNGAVIGANSVVTRNVESYAVVAGCPARLIRYRGQGEKSGEAVRRRAAGPCDIGEDRE